MLLGNWNGSTGMSGRITTRVSSSGLIRTVSFHSSSFASGGRMTLSQVTRLSTYASNKWKYMGCRKLAAGALEASFFKVRCRVGHPFVSSTILQQQTRTGGPPAQSRLPAGAPRAIAFVRTPGAYS
jgi:hypothetical protein